VLSVRASFLGLVLLLSSAATFAQAPPPGGAERAPAAEVEAAKVKADAAVKAKAAATAEADKIKSFKAQTSLLQQTLGSTAAAGVMGATAPGGSGQGDPSPIKYTASAQADAARAFANVAVNAKSDVERQAAAVAAGELAKAAQATLEADHREKEAARTLGIKVLAFSGIVLVLVVLVDRMRKLLPWQNSTYRLFGLTIIVFAGIFLIVTGYSETQIAPVVGLLGTALGYVLGKESPSVPQEKDPASAASKPEPKSPPGPATDPVVPATPATPPSPV
jgi:hypothetical protein